MERFNSIYPFTTENIAGYFSELDLTDKKIITVTGSSDHIINSILLGAKEILTFDINPLTEKYMNLKLSGIKELSYEEFLNVFLYDTEESLNYHVINSLNIDDISREFWLNELQKNHNNGLELKKSSLFYRKYFNPKSKFWQNLYLNKDNYNYVKNKIDNCIITYINCNLKDLNIKEDYDYMFLSNISDYLDSIFQRGLIEYKKLLNTFLNYVNNIYFAYIYDINKRNYRSNIDNFKIIDKIFNNYKIKKFKSALENTKNIQDGVLILRRK